MQTENQFVELLNSNTETRKVTSKHRTQGLEEALIKDNMDNPMRREELAEAIETLRKSCGR